MGIGLLIISALAALLFLLFQAQPRPRFARTTAPIADSKAKPRVQLTPLDTRRVAELYVAALQAGDRESARALIRGEALCSGPVMFDVLDQQLAMLSHAEVRNLRIEVYDLTGSVAYSPGTEGAAITLEMRPSADSPWRHVELGIATYGAERRAICWLWTAGGQAPPDVVAPSTGNGAYASTALEVLRAPPNPAE